MRTSIEQGEGNEGMTTKIFLFLKKEHSYVVLTSQHSKAKPVQNYEHRKRPKRMLQCKVFGPLLNCCPRQDPPLIELRVSQVHWGK